MEIAYRRLTRQEAEFFSAGIAKELGMSDYAPSALQRYGKVYIAIVDGRAAGLGIYRRLAYGWAELALMYVRPEYRGTGIGHALFERRVQRASKEHRSLYVSSTNPTIIHFMEAIGMTMVTDGDEMPLNLRLAKLYDLVQRGRFIDLWNSIQGRSSGVTTYGMLGIQAPILTSEVKRAA